MAFHELNSNIDSEVKKSESEMITTAHPFKQSIPSFLPFLQIQNLSCHNNYKKNLELAEIDPVR
jgi:hypothetical protein